MLSQVDMWAEYAGMVLDLVLMLRILTLKLRQTYMFITLFALLELFYDGVQLKMGAKSPEFGTVVIFSKFVFAIVYPLVCWDLFEEAKSIVDKVRKLAMARMMSSLLFITLWGLLIAAFTGDDNSEQSHYLMRLALIVWTGSVASALAFLWVMRRGIKANHWELPWNTAIWYRYFQLLLIIEAVSCVLYLIFPALAANLADSVSQIGEVVLQLLGIILTIWCVFKLRAVPSDATNVPVDVNS